MSILKLMFVILLLSAPSWAATRIGNTGNYNSQISATQPGDTLILQAGTYPNFLFPCTKSTNANPTTITIEDGATVIITGEADFASTDPCPGEQNGLILDGKNGLYFDHQWTNSNVGWRHQHGSIDNGLLKNFTVTRTRHHGMFVDGNNITLQNIRVSYIGVDGNGNPIPGVENACGSGGPAQCHGLYLINNGLPMILDGLNVQYTHGWCAVMSSGVYTLKNNTLGNCGRYGEGGGFQIYSGVSGSIAYNNVIYDSAGSGLAFLDGGIAGYHNTVVGNGGGVYAVGGSAILRNNVMMDNSFNFQLSGGGNTSSNNLCGGSGGTTNCQLAGVVSDTFANAPGDDYHLKVGSEAIDAGFDLAGLVSLDQEGNARDSTPDLGAYQFAASEPAPNPVPGTVIIDLPFNQTSGTSVTDAAGGDHTGTWNECAGNACWSTLAAEGTGSANLNGSRFVEVLNPTAAKSTESGAISAWFKLTSTGTNGCDVSLGDSLILRVKNDGNVEGVIYDGSGWPSALSTGRDAIDDTWHHAVVSYDRSFLRVWLDNSNIISIAETSPISHTLGPNFRVGRHANGGSVAEWNCTGQIDRVAVLDGFCDPACVANFFNEEVSTPDVSNPYTAWINVNTNDITGTINAPRSHGIDQPLAIRFLLVNSGALIDEYFPLEVCNLDDCESDIDWIPVTETPNSVGVYMEPDPLIGTGYGTGQLLTFGGFTFTPGRYVIPKLVTLEWDAVVDPLVIGYRLYYGTVPGIYTNSVDVGLATTATVTLMPGAIYYFAATSYSETTESTFSNEVSEDLAFSTDLAAGEMTEWEYRRLRFTTPLTGVNDDIKFRVTRENGDALTSSVSPVLTILPPPAMSAFGGTFQGVRLQ